MAIFRTCEAPTLRRVQVPFQRAQMAIEFRFPGIRLPIQRPSLQAPKLPSQLKKTSQQSANPRLIDQQAFGEKKNIPQASLYPLGDWGGWVNSGRVT